MDNRGRNILDPRVLIALCIVLVGVIFLLKNMGVNIDIKIWQFWPLILIILGISLMARTGESRQGTSGIILLLIGVIFLLNNLDISPWGFKEIWPIFIILIGILILRNVLGRGARHPSSADYINLSLILGGGENKFDTPDFKGGSVTAFMGGGTIDLREADIQEDEVSIDALAFWGGIEIMVPKHWQVNVRATPILGGFENKTSLAGGGDVDPQGGKQIKKLSIKGLVIMGGIEIKN